MLITFYAGHRSGAGYLVVLLVGRLDSREIGVAFNNGAGGI